MTTGEIIYLIAIIIYGIMGITALVFYYMWWATESFAIGLTSCILISVATPILIAGAVCGAVL